MTNRGKFDAIVIGSKPKDDMEDESEKDSPDMGEAGAAMAVRQLAKAFGINPMDVDTNRAVNAFRAAVAACEGKDDYEDENDNKGGYKDME